MFFYQFNHLQPLFITLLPLCLLLQFLHSFNLLHIDIVNNLLKDCIQHKKAWPEVLKLWLSKQFLHTLLAKIVQCLPQVHIYLCNLIICRNFTRTY